MKQYECNNIAQVAHKVEELLNCKPEKSYREYIKALCKTHKLNGYSEATSFDGVHYDKNDNELDCNILINYLNYKWYVAIQIDSTGEWL